MCEPSGRKRGGGPHLKQCSSFWLPLSTPLRHRQARGRAGRGAKEARGNEFSPGSTGRKKRGNTREEAGDEAKKNNWRGRRNRETEASTVDSPSGAKRRSYVRKDVSIGSTHSPWG